MIDLPTDGIFVLNIISINLINSNYNYGYPGVFEGVFGVGAAPLKAE